MTSVTAAATPSSPASASDDRSLSFRRTLAFSATSLPINAAIVALMIHLPPYIATNIGVPLAAVGVIFAICRFIDIPVEPLLGLAMDRTRTRFGRYRVWTLIGAPLLMLGFFMLLQAERGEGSVYLIGWLLVMYLGLSTLVLSHAAWGSTLARTYNDRARIYGVMGGAGVLGSIGVLLFPIVMEKMGLPDSRGVRAMIWYVIALTPVCVGVVVMLTPERVAPPAAHAQAFRLRDYTELVAHPAMWRILLADLCLTMGPGWMSALFIFFSRDRMHFSIGQANQLLVVYILAGLVGAPCMAWFATKVGKHRACQIACLVYSAALVAIVFLPPGNVWANMPVNMVTGFVATGFVALTRAMVADVTDDIRLKQGKERGGLLFSLTTSTAKIATAGGTIITYPFLASIGYDPKAGTHNSAEAIQGLTWAFLAGPTFFLALGAACFIGYGLTAEKAAETRRQLEARDAQLAASET